jgi:hypothetical protein
MQGSKDLLATRIREIRLERFGNDGTATVAEAMSIPTRTWENFENGVTIPALILLQFIEITGVQPYWLLSGKGERYSVPSVQPFHRAIRWRCTNETGSSDQEGSSGVGSASLPGTK